MWMRRHPAWSWLIGLGTLGIVSVIAGIAIHNITLQQALDRSQRIISAGRDHSRWLLSDFTEVLESDDGLTAVQSALADRTQNYLDQLLKEASEDRDLKVDLAYAFTQLAMLQGQPDAGSLGRPDLAKQNLESAEELLKSLEPLTTKEAIRAQVSLDLQKANLAYA